MCQPHYSRWYRSGDPENYGKTRFGMTREARFWSQVEKTEYCWLWTGGTIRGGYGRFSENAKRYLVAHRVAYESLVGAIPDGLVLDHLCRNTICVNPDHLEPVTRRENTLRGLTTPRQNARKTHCKNGHEFTPENTYIHNPSKKEPFGARECRTCHRERERARRIKRLAARSGGC